MTPATLLLAVIVGAAAAVVALHLRLPRAAKIAAAAVIAFGVGLIVFGVSGLTGDRPAAGVVPGRSVHTIEPPGPSGGIR